MRALDAVNVLGGECRPQNGRSSRDAPTSPSPSGCVTDVQYPPTFTRGRRRPRSIWWRYYPASSPRISETVFSGVSSAAAKVSPPRSLLAPIPKASPRRRSDGRSHEQCARTHRSCWDPQPFTAHSGFLCRPAICGHRSTVAIGSTAFGAVSARSDRPSYEHCLG
jgi:hypothetical protein